MGGRTIRNAATVCGQIDGPVDANTMWHTFLFPGFETCFGHSTQSSTHGAGTKTHPKSRFCLQAILKNGAVECPSGVII